MSLAVARTAGLDVLGAVVRVQILVQLVALVAQWGGRQALVRAMATEPGGRTAQWRAGVVARLPVLVVPGALLVAVLAPGSMRTVAVIWFAALWFTEMVEARVTVGRHFVAAGLVDVAVLGAALVALASVPDRTIAVVWVYAGAASLRSGMLWWTTQAAKPRPVACRTGIDRLRVDSPLAGAALAGYGQSRGAVVLAAAALDPAPLAVFSVLANLIQMARTAVALLHRPHAAALHRLRTPSVLAFARSQALLVAAPVISVLAVLFAVVGRLYGFTVDVVWLIPAALAVAPLVWRMPVTLRLFGTDRAVAVWWSTAVVAMMVMVTGGPVLSALGVVGGLWLLAGSELAMTASALFMVAAVPHRFVRRGR